jgi:predicted dehydrogenase
MRKATEDLRIGVIGAGGRGNLAWNAHKPGEGSRIVAIADPNEGWLEKRDAESGGGLFKTKDYRKLLARKDVDAVFICAPDFLHEEMAIASLEAGKATYLEKPMTITLAGCDKVLETAMRTKTKLYLGHNMRHFPAVLKMKELIEAGAIGRLQAVWCRHFVEYGGDAYFKDWHSERKYSTGLLLQKGAHDIDVIHWLSGAFTRRVVGMGKLSVYDKCQRRQDSDDMGYELKRGRWSDFWNNANWPPKSQRNMSKHIDVEDQSMILMQLENGVQATYLQCHYTPDSCRNYTFIGDEGRLENIGDAGNCQINLYNLRGSSMAKPDAVFNVREISGSHGGADPRIVAEFVRYAKGEGKASTCPVAAREAVATGFLGTESLRDGSTPREVPPPSRKIIAHFAKLQGK